MLEQTNIFEGLTLPLALGSARLQVSELGHVAMVAPFKGQSMAVAKALQASLGMILPPTGRVEQSDNAKAYWREPGKWLVFADEALITQSRAALKDMASVIDMSDSISRVILTGEAANTVLARLVGVDCESLETADVAHTALADIPVSLIAVETGFEIIMPRSLTKSAVKRLKVAMRSVAAQALLG